jgi:hypothetical protein
MSQAQEGLLSVVDVVGRRALGDPDVGAVRHVEVTWRNAGDRRVELGEADRFADDRGITVVQRLPQPRRDHDRRQRSLLRRRVWRWGLDWREVVVRKATGGHRETEQLEESFAHRVHRHVRRRVVGGEQREVERLESCRTFDRQARVVQPVDLAAGQKPGGDAPVGERRSEAVEIIRIGIRQWLEEDRTQRGEDRRRCADAEGECGDRRERESGRAAKSAERNADVLKNRFHSWTPDPAAKECITHYVLVTTRTT